MGGGGGGGGGGGLVSGVSCAILVERTGAMVNPRTLGQSVTRSSLRRVTVGCGPGPVHLKI